MKMFSMTVPNVTFKTRVETDEQPGFAWKDLTTTEIFSEKRIALFALPGAFTPTCSSTHLPGYEEAYNQLKDCGIDEEYCLSVNDSFTMNSWLKSMGVQNVKPLPDGSAEFTRKMGMLVNKDNLGFGSRSWRYSFVANNGIIENLWQEPGLMDNSPSDPFMVSDAQTMLTWLQSDQAKRA